MKLCFRMLSGCRKRGHAYTTQTLFPFACLSQFQQEKKELCNNASCVINMVLAFSIDLFLSLLIHYQSTPFIYVFFRVKSHLNMHDYSVIVYEMLINDKVHMEGLIC